MNWRPDDETRKENRFIYVMLAIVLLVCGVLLYGCWTTTPI